MDFRKLRAEASAFFLLVLLVEVSAHLFELVSNKQFSMHGLPM